MCPKDKLLHLSRKKQNDLNEMTVIIVTVLKILKSLFNCMKFKTNVYSNFSSTYTQVKKC